MHYSGAHNVVLFLSRSLLKCELRYRFTTPSQRPGKYKINATTTFYLAVVWVAFWKYDKEVTKVTTNSQGTKQVTNRALKFSVFPVFVLNCEW